MRKQHGGGGAEVFRITGARTGLQEDVRGRQRRYVISMSVRTVAVLLAVVLWDVQRYVAIVALVLGAALPYIAVVIANAGRENAPRLPSTFVTAPMKPMISPPRTAQDGAGDSAQDGARGSTRGGARDSAQDGAPGGARSGTGDGAGGGQRDGTHGAFGSDDLTQSAAGDTARDPAAGAAGSAREHRDGL
ncbi:DUF3099 domain-containing protein [Streptomyces sp. NPDC018057]|uniref:DUF3099 domain-containing protein n=1 Tax=unclassified Streptomyces TaxID=2593676 RepID=UPI0037BA09D8